MKSFVSEMYSLLLTATFKCLCIQLVVWGLSGTFG